MGTGESRTHLTSLAPDRHGEHRPVASHGNLVRPSYRHHVENWRRPARRGEVGEQRTNGVVTFADDRGNAGLEDARLLRRNLLACLPEVLDVIDADGRHTRDYRMNDVRGVQASAEAGLDHRG